MLHEARDIWVVCAAATHKDLVNILTRRIFLVVIDDSLSGDPSGRGDNIVGGQSSGLGATNQIVGQSVSKDLASGTEGSAQ